VEIPLEKFGHFWSAHSYIVLYTYGAVNPSFIIYFWQGRHSTVSDKGTSSTLSLSLSKIYRGSSQVRVVQNKEPRHFKKYSTGN